MGTQSAVNFLGVLRNQKHGFRFGKPQRVDETSLSVILPILRTTSIKRQYITMPETEKLMVFDTGKIDEMDAYNKSDEHVFIRSGTLFRGSTQERALQRSAVVFSRKKSRLNVRCVHASKGISGGASTIFGGLVPHDVETNVYGKGFAPKDQATYWSSVTSANVNMMRCMDTSGIQYSSTLSDNFADDTCLLNRSSSHDWQPLKPKADDLASNLDKFSLTFDELLSKVRLVDNQAGLSVINDGGVQTIEVFDHTDSWKALHEAAVKRMGTEIIKEDKENVFEFKPENAIKMVDRVLSCDWTTNKIYEHRPTNGEPPILITGLSSNEYVGEIVEFAGTVIHMLILKQATPQI